MMQRYTLSEVSSLTGKPLAGLRKRVERGTLPTIKIEGIHYVTEETLHSLLGAKAHKFTFESLVNKWQAEMLNGYHTGKPLSKQYVANLKLYLDRYFNKLGIEPSIQGITPDNLKACYSSFEPDDKKQTCFYEAKKYIQRAVLSFAKLLERETLIGHEQIEKLKSIKIHRAYNNGMQSLDIETIQAVIDEAGKQRRGRPRYGQCLYQTLAALAGLAGLRQSEIINLKLKDIDLKQGIIFVSDGKGHKSRTVGIMPQLNKILKEWLFYRAESPSKYFLITKQGNKLTKSAIIQKMQDVSKNLGKSITLHELRAGFATVTSSMGMPLPLIQNAMGHTDIKTTMRYVRHFEVEAVNWLKNNGA